MKKFVCWVVGSLLVFSVAPAFASGYGVFTQGAEGLGQANAVVAHATGPSSLYFNPALLPQVPGTRIEVGTTMIYADREFKSDLTGQSENGDNSASFPSTFYATHQFNDELSAGLGVYFPFGLSTEWDEDWEGRYIATKSDLFTVNFNPVVAYRPTEQLTVAAGLDVLYLDAELKRQVNSSLIGMILNPPGGFGPLPDAGQKFTGDGWGVGYNLGLLLQISEHVDFGATYRSHIDVDINDGDLKFSLPPGAAMLAPVLANTGGETNLRLPEQATFAIAWEASEKLTLEVGARWEDWSSTTQLRIKLDQPVLGQSVDITPRDWDDTWAFNIGGKYQLNENVDLLAGYLYSDNPVPNPTFDPSIPDSDSHVFTIGTGLHFGAWTLDLAYGYEHHENRDKNNQIGLLTGSPANGEYSADNHLAALSVGYQFP
jgi:long-chain fatty acid transport protein